MSGNETRDVVMLDRPTDWFEITLAAVFALSGMVQIVSGARPTTLAALLPEAFRVLWLALIVLGSLAALFGVLYTRDRITALYVESVGLIAVASAAIIYGIGLGIVAFSVDSVGGQILSAPTYIVIGTAFYLKRKQVLRLIERLPKK